MPKVAYARRHDTVQYTVVYRVLLEMPVFSTVRVVVSGNEVQ